MFGEYPSPKLPKPRQNVEYSFNTPLVLLVERGAPVGAECSQQSLRCHVVWWNPVLVDVRRDCVAMCVEIVQGTHERVSESTEMRPIFDILGENVAWIDFARNVSHHGASRRLRLSHSVFAEIEVLDSFRGHSG